MFSFGAYNDDEINAAGNVAAGVQDFAPPNHNISDEKESSYDPTHNTTTMQDFSKTMSDASNTAPSNMEIHPEIENLMNQVNEDLERELKETKKAVQRIFKEMVAFQKVATTIHADWAPIREAEYQEALRLDDLQAEVEGTIGAMPGLRLDIPPPEHQLEPPSSSM